MTGEVNHLVLACDGFEEAHAALDLRRIEIDERVVEEDEGLLLLIHGVDEGHAPCELHEVPVAGRKKLRIAPSARRCTLKSASIRNGIVACEETSSALPAGAGIGEVVSGIVPLGVVASVASEALARIR